MLILDLQEVARPSAAAANGQAAQTLRTIVVRHREIETEQGDDGADQPFGLPQGQAKHRFQRHRRRDRQLRITPLAASRRS